MIFLRLFSLLALVTVCKDHVVQETSLTNAVVKIFTLHQDFYSFELNDVPMFREEYI